MCDPQKSEVGYYAMKEVSSAVHRAIQNYQLTSNSKQLKRLNHKNEARIVANLKRKHQDRHLIELIQKRDHYNNKINELLNNAAEQSDPSLIEDDYEADYYLAKRFIRVPENVDQVRAIIEKHKVFQDDASQEYQQIMGKYEHKPHAANGLAKLKAKNASDQANRQDAKDKALSSLYEKVAYKQRALAQESEAMLRQLQVPIFCMQNGVCSDEDKIQRNKEHVIETLSKLVQKR